MGRGPVMSGELVALAYSDPEQVMALAAATLDEPGLAEGDRCQALWALGLAQRELGDTERAAESLSRGRSVALAAGEPATAGRIATTLALSLSQLGQPTAALDLLDEAEPALADVDRAHLQLQRGLILMYEERIDEALAPALEALELFAAHGDRLGVARTHLNVGVILGSLHRHAEAMEHAQLAATHAAELHQNFLAAQARHNVGYAAYRLGDVPVALSEMAVAEEQLRSLGGASPLVLATMLQDRALVELEAHLVDDAVADAEAALTAAEAGSNAVLTAEATLLAARCQLTFGALDRAGERARLAARRLRAAGRISWVPLADLIGIKATAAAGGRPDADAAVTVADDLAGRRWWSEAAEAALLAASALTASGDRERAIVVLARLRHQPLGSTALERSAAALVRARHHELRGDHRAARAAVTKGIKALTENLVAMGALEVRARAAAHGSELTEVGMRLAHRDGRARELLVRVELGRGAATRVRRVLPYRDPGLNAAIVTYRDLTRRIHDELEAGRTPGRLVAERVRVEAEIKERARRTRSGGGLGPDDIGAAVRALGGVGFLEYVELGGELSVVVIEAGRARLVELGRLDVAPVLDQMMLGIHRLNRGRSSAASQQAAEALIADAGATLSRMLVPSDLVVPDEGVVIVPSPRLHSVPWRAIPALDRVPVRVAPSLLVWQRVAAGTVAAPTAGFVAGPGLDHADREVAHLASLFDRCEVLDSTASSVEAVADLLGRVDIVHLACHGMFRADNPMFSALRLAGGDFTVYDLEAIDRLPQIVVLSACDVGRSGVLPGAAVLGLASSLVQFGVSSVVAPLSPVNDERSVDLMARLHAGLARGVPAAAALAAATIRLDGTSDPTATAFICFGC